MNIGWYNHFF